MPIKHVRAVFLSNR